MLSGLLNLGPDYSKTCVKRPLSKRQKISFQDQLSLNAGQKYCRMFQREHSAILLTFIKLPFVIKIFVLSIFDCPFYTHFTVFAKVISRCTCRHLAWSFLIIVIVIIAYQWRLQRGTHTPTLTRHHGPLSDIPSSCLVFS